jgi:hypothetical protein
VLRCQIEEAFADVEHPRHHRQHEFSLPHPVHRHVDVVAAARRVQASGAFLTAGAGDQTVDVEKQIL